LIYQLIKYKQFLFKSRRQIVEEDEEEEEEEEEEGQEVASKGADQGEAEQDGPGVGI
jgi:CO dehydrogenase/acetyl-CoA synthase beta subunit